MNAILPLAGFASVIFTVLFLIVTRADRRPLRRRADDHASARDSVAS